MDNISLQNLIKAILVCIFGNYWYIFITYMIFNLLDWITGSLKALKLKKVSSNIGINGLIKKLGYWVVIGIAFSFSVMFVIIGKEILNINLSIMYSLGWFTFAILIINEIISILENLISLGIKVPSVLIKSIKATESILDDTGEKILKNKNSDK